MGARILRAQNNSRAKTRSEKSYGAGIARRAGVRALIYPSEVSGEGYSLGSHCEDMQTRQSPEHPASAAATENQIILVRISFRVFVNLRSIHNRRSSKALPIPKTYRFYPVCSSYANRCGPRGKHILPPKPDRSTREATAAM